VAGLVAAAAVAVVLLFFTGPLQYVPTAALGAVLVKAAYSLVNVRALQTFYRMDWRELAVSLLATMGVVAIGAVEAILVAVVLALIRFVRRVSRPRTEILGEVEGLPGLHCIARHPEATTIPGLVLFRFNAPIVFFNAPYFKRQVLAAADQAGAGLKWLVIDMIPVSMMDVTGLYAAADVAAALRERNVTFAAAGRQTEWSEWLASHKVERNEAETVFFPTLRAAIKAYRAEGGGTAAEPSRSV
jgi:MFS superfamily sulfate permease-like transporter